jgi:4-hydroxybenzoate polyprenyltransferase
MGWAAAFGSLAWPAVAIYACAIFWTIGYDTIYALQDARDDAIAGVRSTARLFAHNVRSGVSLFYLLAVLAGALAVQWSGGRVLAWLGLCGFSLHLAWQIRSIEPDNAARALLLFRSNRNAGLILFAGLALDGSIAALLR